MGLILMSERELHRIEVLSEVLERRRTLASAAIVLSLSVRQVQRIVRTFCLEGAPALRHRSRGRRSNNRINDGVRELALQLVRERYADFGPTLAAEKLAEHGFGVSRETLRKWMAEAGLWLSRKQRRTFRQPRLRRECYGELIQIDGSDHRWFEDRGDRCTLLVFIDDATGRLMQLLFVRSESAFSYFAALELYLQAHGRPVAFYSDKHSVFRVGKTDVKSGEAMTQFGRALSELSIEILCANSSQAKGRVERVNRTLQDRLVKELRLAGIGDIAAGNAFLPGFIERFNARFAIEPIKADNLHRPLNIAPNSLQEILCRREQRYVGQQLTFSFERQRVMLEENEVTRGLVGKYVDLYAFADGRFQVRWKGVTLPYTLFDSAQRVTHAAITESKRLGDVLAFIKERQDQFLPPPKVKTNSEVNGYQKRGRKPPGRKGWVDQMIDRRAREQVASAPSTVAGQGCDIEVSALPGDAPRRLSG
ncbi:ISNCY family transposase [Rhizobium tubonense]|uniref:ISNCY family transposase n=1 Tax=Rhizobium tubonense TaxID=484088 RepID=UPI001FCEAEEE|nr:ISNCY family transposase [Rhizobium tubonense]